MKLEEIQAAWDKDCKVDRSELGYESTRTPELHNKYFKLLLLEGQTLRMYEAEYKKLYKLKWEYYLGQLDKDTLARLKWEPFALKILKSDVDTYLEADDGLIAAKEKFDYQKAKFEYLESILKKIHTRAFDIKNAIEWEKFKVGN